MNRMLCRMNSHGYSHSQNCTQLAWSPGKRCCTLKGDMNRNCHGAKFSISVCALHQSSWKFCIYLYMGFIVLLPEYHLLQVIVVHILHILRRNQFPSKSCIHSQMFCDKENVANIIPQQQSTSIAETLYEVHDGVSFICNHVRHFDYDHNVTKYSHISLDSVQAGT
jgi:hypothetical protein